ncbi:hypothetical protein F5141DRAFT_1142665 [Pisolithus sp. B1]|nr:hypothetical protein F5141DRAFT_1142665 [Pisolithus sp. B1]
MRLDVHYQRLYEAAMLGSGPSQPRPSLFGGICDDISNHQLLVLHLRLGGDPHLRNSYFINIQTDGPATTDLRQLRLYFKRKDRGWVDIFIPFNDFILTNIGELVQYQIAMFQGRIRTVGISLLGGNSGAPETYESYDLGTKHAINEEDAMMPPSSAVDRHIILAHTYKV